MRERKGETERGRERNRERKKEGDKEREKKRERETIDPSQLEPNFWLQELDSKLEPTLFLL